MFNRIDGDRFEGDGPAVVGDKVVIVEGPFRSFDAIVKEIDDRQSQAIVIISVFGKDCDVTVYLSQIKKSSQ